MSKFPAAIQCVCVLLPTAKQIVAELDNDQVTFRPSSLEKGSDQLIVTLYINYLVILLYTADPNPFRGTHCMIMQGN